MLPAGMRSRSQVLSSAFRFCRMLLHLRLVAELPFMMPNSDSVVLLLDKLVVFIGQGNGVVQWENFYVIVSPSMLSVCARAQVLLMFFCRLQYSTMEELLRCRSLIFPFVPGNTKLGLNLYVYTDALRLS